MHIFSNRVNLGLVRWLVQSSLTKPVFSGLDISASVGVRGRARLRFIRGRVCALSALPSVCTEPCEPRRDSQTPARQTCFSVGCSLALLPRVCRLLLCAKAVRCGRGVLVCVLLGVFLRARVRL